MMCKKCVICDLYLISDVVTVKKKGLQTLVAASQARGDNKYVQFEDKLELRLHRKCRLKYIEEKCITACKKRNQSNEVVKPTFDFDHCIFCNKNAGQEFVKSQQKYPIDRRISVYQVRKLDTQATILKAAETHHDDWSRQVLQRIEDVNLLEVNAVYHGRCYSKFCHSKRPTGRKRGRHLSLENANAMNLIYSFLETNTVTRQFSLSDIRNALSDVELPSDQVIKYHLKQHYGDETPGTSLQSSSTFSVPPTGYVDSDADSVITDEEDAQVPEHSNKANAARTVVTDNASEGETSISLYHDTAASRKQAKASRAAQSGAAHDIICNECHNGVTGFRYACVQCADYDLCAACEAAGAHAQHYVLRIPRPTPHIEIMNLLRKIRTELESGALSANPEDTEPREETMKLEIKVEVPDLELDPLAVIGEIKTEIPEMTQEELAVQSIMQPESSASSILQMPITDAGTHAPSEDAKPAKTAAKRPAPQPIKTDQKQAKERKVLPSNRKIEYTYSKTGSSRKNVPVVATPSTSSRMPQQRVREPSPDSGGFVSEVLTHRTKEKPPATGS